MSDKLNSNEPMKKLDPEQLEAVSGGEADYADTYTHTTEPDDDATSTHFIPAYNGFPDFPDCPDATTDIYPSGTVISRQ